MLTEGHFERHVFRFHFFFLFTSTTSPSVIHCASVPCSRTQQLQHQKSHHRCLELDVNMDLQSIPNSPHPVLTSRDKSSEEDTSPNVWSTAPHLPQDLSRNLESICDECRVVNWNNVPTLAARGLLLTRSRRLRPINANSKQLAASSCRICRLLSLIAPPLLGQSQCMVYAQILSNNASTSASQLPGSRHITALIIGSNGGNRFDRMRKCLVALTGSEVEESRLMLPSSVNYDRLKHLAKYCEGTHGDMCTTGSLDQVPGLMVIDVSSREVMEAPKNCRYLALSYVWGQQPDHLAADALRCAPPLIEDAISVTIALEYRYLWVDRYVRLLNSTSVNVSINKLK